MPKTCTTHHYACRCREAAFHNLAVATRRWVHIMDHWVETDEPATADESKAIYDSIVSALKACGYDGEAKAWYEEHKDQP